MNVFDLTPTEWQLLLWTMAVGIVCTIPCALLGCYLLLRRMSLMGDAMSHSVLPGIVLAVFLSGQVTSWAIILGAMIFGVLTAWLTQTICSLGNLPEDAGMGVVFTALFALGVVLIDKLFRNSHLDDCVLYGTLEAVPLHSIYILGIEIPATLPTLLGTLSLTLVFLTFFWKELKIVAFDSDLATAMGMPTSVIHYLLMAMVAAITVSAFEVVGSVLVIAMLIVPGATAHLLTDRLFYMLLWSAVVAVVSTVLGVFLAGPSAINTNAAGMMAVVAGFLFTLAVLFSPRQGVLSKMLRNFRLGLRISSEDIITALYKHDEAKRRQDPEAMSRLQEEVNRVSVGIFGRLAGFVLARRGLLQIKSDGPTLTDKGRAQAESIVRSHRLWESYLDQHFPLPADHLHEPAERIEHYIGPQLQEQLVSELQQPNTDPHGREIPPLPDNDS